MNNLFEEKRTLFLLLLCLVFLGLLALYLFFLQPLSAELQNTRNMNASLESELAVLEAKKDPESGQDIDTLLLQKKVPLNPELEKLLLTFQQIEQTSGSRIEEVDFLYDGSEPEFDFVKEEDEESNRVEQDSTNEKEPSSSEKTSSENSEDTEKPDKLHLVTAKLNVLSPDHEHFIHFLREIEKLERVTRVDQLQVNKPTEQVLDFHEKPDKTVSFTVDVTTFYYEK
ncbi:hypothetical protein QNH23_00055 [Siminovitchia fortis]|uniref:Uncharacterized protein n=1 Tax=Siminovitchia fortis TaxID=254758 RepID=A0A443IUS9_9BACI|nr:hypothetical protein [Siminovitchia fortis]RWR11858.1 hypothetical protein D4N35_007930 [Siminovitchia fortis]WHY81862.1 hypothetical protein QNH23_00055 [Siminovitchia fortis]